MQCSPYFKHFELRNRWVPNGKKKRSGSSDVLEIQPVQSQWGQPWTEPVQTSHCPETKGPSSKGRASAADKFRIY